MLIVARNKAHAARIASTMEAAWEAHSRGKVEPSQPAARCYCGECIQLDGKRLQGIPGTYQMRLDGVPAAECQAMQPEPQTMRPVDGLPLFDGSLEPVLF